MNMKPIAFSAESDAVRILFDGPFDPSGLATIEDANNYVVLDAKLARIALHDPVQFDASTLVAVLKPAARPLAGAVMVRVLAAITGGADLPFEQVALGSAEPSAPNAVAVSGPVNVQLGPDNLVLEARDALRTQRDAFSYPMLTEEIGSGSRPSGSGGSRGGGNDLSALVNRTLGDVLGWKTRTDDPAAFEGALTASFDVDEVDGVSTWKWTPRTYAVQSDLAGGITGAQASLYKRAQEALDQSLPLLDGLYPLDPKADAENIAALKAVVRTQLSQLVGELATPGGPGEVRVNSYFGLLLAKSGTFQSGGGGLVTSEPDDLGGTLGELRDQLGLRTTQKFVNTIEDEQDLTNFRILADYVTGLAQTWLNNRHFFGLGKGGRFLGTQLVPLSRQLTVISESVDDVRFALDSVFIGAAERQTLQLSFGNADDGMYAEDFLQWIQNFVDDEAPIYVQQGGKFGIGNSLLPIARRLHGMAGKLRHQPDLPRGFQTSRVERSVDALAKELGQLVTLAEPVGRDFAPVVASAVLLVTPGELDMDFKTLNGSHRISLINTGEADVTVIGTINKGSDSFKFLDGGDQSAGPLTFHLKSRQTLDVIITDTTKASPDDTGSADFAYRLADGTGGTKHVKVLLSIVDRT